MISQNSLHAGCVFCDQYKIKYKLRSVSTSFQTDSVVLFVVIYFQGEKSCGSMEPIVGCYNGLHLFTSDLNRYLESPAD